MCASKGKQTAWGKLANAARYVVYSDDFDFPTEGGSGLDNGLPTNSQFSRETPSPSLIILLPHHPERIVLGGNFMQSVGQGPRIMASDFLYGPSHWLNHQFFFCS